MVVVWSRGRRVVAAAGVLLGVAVAFPPAAHAAGAPPVRASYPTPHGPEPMDVYLPPASNTHTPYPGIVFVHGGGWSAGDEKEFATEAKAAAAHGYAAFAIGYDLASPRDPRQARDVLAAVSAIRADAGRYHVDPDRLAGWGESAGAHLVMQAAVTGHAPLRAVVGWSGPYDLARFVADADPVYAQLARDFLGCDPVAAACARKAAAASPALHTAVGDPAALLVNSADEIVRTDQPAQLAANLRAAGSVAQTLTLPGTRHGIAYGADATAPSLRFLDLHLPVRAGADPVRARYQALGGARSYLGDPTGPEYAVAGGRAQQFTGGVVYWSPATGAHVVRGAILAAYLRLGGPDGPLGFPTSDETSTVPRTRHLAVGHHVRRAGHVRGRRQHAARTSRFAHGDITWTARTGAAVHYR